MVEVGELLESIRDFWDQYKQNRVAVIGLALLLVFGFLGVFASIIMPYDPLDQTLMTTPDSKDGVLKPPSSKHIFGTDELGRDVFSRFIWGSRASLLVGCIAAGVSAFLGLLLGSTAGFLGGKVDAVIMRSSDVFLTMSTFFTVLLVITIWGRSLGFIIFMIGVTYWPSTARLVRAEVLSLKEQDFTTAARAAGATSWYIITREIIPNAAFIAIVNATMQVAGAITIEASLAFLGLGDPYAISLGWQLQFGMRAVRSAWWLGVFPGLGLTLIVVAFNLISDGLNEALNPYMKERDLEGM